MAMWTEAEKAELEQESRERWERQEFDALMKRIGNIERGENMDIIAEKILAAEEAAWEKNKERLASRVDRGPMASKVGALVYAGLYPHLADVLGHKPNSAEIQEAAKAGFYCPICGSWYNSWTELGEVDEQRVCNTCLAAARFRAQCEAEEDVTSEELFGKPKLPEVCRDCPNVATCPVDRADLDDYAYSHPCAYFEEHAAYLEAYNRVVV